MAYNHGILAGTVSGRWPDVEYAGTNIAGNFSFDNIRLFFFFLCS